MSTSCTSARLSPEQPQTLAHALADSPVGVLAWNGQCMADLDPDALLTHVTIYWLTGTAGSAPRIYAEEDRQQPPDGPTTIPPGLVVPLGLAQFANDWPSDRALAERQNARIRDLDRQRRDAARSRRAVKVARQTWSRSLPENWILSGG